MKEFTGLNIREVWDYRLSRAVPQINNFGPTWVVNIFAKDNPEHTPGAESIPPLESYDTGIPSEPGDTWDTDKIKKCYEWLYSVRDKYSLPDIEKRKPLVAQINAANDRLAALNVGV